VSSLERIHSYFDRAAVRFDSIYQHDKPLHQQVGDAVFRRVIHTRYLLVINALGARSKKILDVGCGSGRYGVELAARGADHCVGVDVSQQMIDLAVEAAATAGVAARCSWHVSDFLSWHTDDSFDASMAMGYFDYTEDPHPHLLRMLALVHGRIFASFPKRWEFRVPLRMARFAVARGFVRFYSRADVLNLFRQTTGRSDFRRFLSLIDLGRDYVAIYDSGSARIRKA
jgi:2-polyprenyl-3-methyl-5-hydroxy-6-metoxy-1,4-benzoquinol methylase